MVYSQIRLAVIYGLISSRLCYKLERLDLRRSSAVLQSYFSPTPFPAHSQGRRQSL